MITRATQKHNKSVLIVIGLAIAINFALISSCFLTDNLDPELHLIPNNYRGEVYIIFNQENGRKKEYYKNRRLYQIPSSGVLLTEFESNPGWIINDSIIKIYYIDDANRLLKRIHSMYLTSLNDPMLMDSLVATGIEYHNAGFNDTNLVVCKYTIDTLKLLQSKPLSKIDIDLLRKAIKR